VTRVLRICIAALACALAVSAAAFAKDLAIPGQQMWTDTGVDVAAGTQLTISANGSIRFSSTDAGKTPDGDPACTAPPSFLAPGLTCYSLVGRIGSGTPFEVASQDTLIAGNSGRLFLAPNDDSFFDNSGSWQAHIEGAGQFPSTGWWAPSHAAPIGDAAANGGLTITWTASYVYPYSGQPGAWYVDLVYRNGASQPLGFDCAGQTDPSSTVERIAGTGGGVVAASATLCSRHPDFRTTVGPGGSFDGWAIFSVVPRIGSRVSIQLGASGSSSYVDPFARSFSATPPGEQPQAAPAASPAAGRSGAPAAGTPAEPLRPRAASTKRRNASTHSRTKRRCAHRAAKRRGHLRRCRPVNRSSARRSGGKPGPNRGR
jgi:hypothetical protein